MSTKVFFLIAFLGTATGLRAQTDFRVEVDRTELLDGHFLRVSFVAENAENPDFTAPDFGEWTVVGGPSVSTNMSIINGAVSKSQTWTYRLVAPGPGNFYLPPATLTDGDQVWETEPLEISVAPNPDGIPQPRGATPQRDFFGDFFQERPHATPRPRTDPRKTRKKRKIYRI